MPDKTASRTQEFAFVAIVVAGAALRLWQYFGVTSLWIDELALAENVLDRPFGALLTRPLAFDQVAPPGFLALVKAATAAFGSSELVLRLVSLASSLACLPLMATLARRVLGGWTAAFATALFAAGTPFILHGAEVKQYSSDIAVSIVLTLVAHRLTQERSARTFLVAGLVGFAAVCLSMSAVLLLLGLSAATALIAHRRSGMPALRRLLPILVLWAAEAAAATAANLHRVTPATRAYLQRFWEPAFPPLPPRNLAELRWLPRTLLDFWRGAGLEYPWPALYLGLAIVGGVFLWRSRRDETLLLLAPVVVTLGAAAFRQYPFGGRVILFLSPAFLLCAAAGTRLLAEGLARVRVARPLTALLVALPPILAVIADPPVYLNEETRPLLARLAENRRPADAIYVYYGALRAFDFYAPRFGIPAAAAVLGKCHRDDPREYLRELDVLRSRPRVWVLFAHAVPSLAEEPLIRAYLGQIGKEGQAFWFTGADLALYDLSDPARLATSSADSFPVPGPDLRTVSWLGCDAGPHAPGSAAMPGTRP